MESSHRVHQPLWGMPFIAVGLLAWLQTPAFSQEARQASLLLVGRVEAQESGDPLVGAVVRIEGLTPVVTDGGGRFMIEDVPAGHYALEVGYLGRLPVADTLVLELGEFVSVIIRLEDDPIPVKGLEIVVEQRSLVLESAGFYDRRDKSGISATRFTRQDIEKRAGGRVTDLLENIPSTRIMRFPGVPGPVVRINRQGNRFQTFLRPSNALPGCEPSIYVDDLIYHDDRFGEPRVIDMNFLPLDVIEGIEVYTGMTAPARYDADGCGVILIWTRGYR